MAAVAGTMAMARATAPPSRRASARRRRSARRRPRRPRRRAERARSRARALAPTGGRVPPARVPATAPPRSSSSTPRLRRAYCTGPGLRRRKHGRGFVYLDPDGERIDDAEVLQRVHELVIPPAWDEVWICPYPGGHIQATGMDQAGRKQYLYHPRWRARRDQEKFEDMVVFARTLPALRTHVEAELERDGMDRERVLACAARL